ncbi:MAG: TatD family hydrolase [Nitrosopumilaceae archaeon]|nr:TatD family hydrolase [Nitrosopumilaceae archaeon]
MSWLYDAHIHLSDKFYASNIQSILDGMQEMKIKACCVSVDYSNSIETLNLAQQSDLILPFIGIHPERATDNLQLMIQEIEDNFKQIAGIGEIGLDPTYSNSDDDLKNQLKVFEALLGVAEKFNKPVSIHSRKSLDKILEIMTSYNTKHSLLHWFDGSKKQLKKAMDMDFFVSYGPVTVYANDKQSLMSYTREDKILIETDGPVSFSRCFEMKSAQIGFLPSVVFCASKILKKHYIDVVKLVEKNSESFLQI